MLADRHELADIFGYSPDSFRGWVKEGLPVAQKPNPKAKDPRGRARLFDTKRVHRWLVQRATARRR
jgi:phage terminase Nu1 subunit (DNA packaging protein)